MPVLVTDAPPDDLAEWRCIAHYYGCRLPAQSAPATPAAMRRWLKRLGVTVREYLVWEAAPSLKTFAERNRGWSLLRWLGDVLTQLDKYGNLAPPTMGGRQPYWPEAANHQHDGDCQCNACFQAREASNGRA